MPYHCSLWSLPHSPWRSVGSLPALCLHTLLDFDAEHAQISIHTSAVLPSWKASEQATNPCL